ncbi:MAG TPA: AI-2E family transporter [Microbacterium sp.]|uniref:AI-2E family transporter n=1 Tax=Microbacterium arabinogalactanolyticum TaxID=69365 RepID=UPI0025550974|nr:AI-2E family transporter [Microbacterium arabinogalactanolyticum]GLC85079.1 AI-2E family transporter [Microbacterium arabinogalactanolyticum]HWU30343.1 AI-2E family transporter [Microbacterium sp.]
MSDNPTPRFRNPFRHYPPVTDRTVTTEVDEAVPKPLRVTAAYAWRLLVIAGAIALFIWLVMLLKALVIPLMVGILITALLWPAFQIMLRARFPRWLAIATTVIGTIAIVAGLLWLVIWQVRAQWQDVQERTLVAIEQLKVLLLDSPFHLTASDIDGYIAQLQTLLTEQQNWLWSAAGAVTGTAAEVLTGAVLSLFILICLLADGGGIWKWTLRLFPRTARPAVDAAARNGWETVINYARTQMLVAGIDAVGIGVGAALLGVPMAIPVAVLVFLGSFVPIVGAVVTGAVAVFLALVYNGPWIALAMLGVVLLVQQLEGHILQPILMGSAVKVHPLAVVLVVAGGAMIARIPGALFAVPLAAFINVAAVTISTGAWRTGEEPAADLIWSTVPRERTRRNR